VGLIIIVTDDDALIGAVKDLTRESLDTVTIVAETVLGGLGSGSLHAPARRGLTARQVEVLSLIARGRSNRQIGRALGMSERTVTTHTEAIYKRLGVHSRTEAAMLAWRLGIIAPEDIGDVSRLADVSPLCLIEGNGVRASARSAEIIRDGAGGSLRKPPGPIAPPIERG
jgi:DNA-binding CsgD family transcriptional regulator